MPEVIYLFPGQSSRDVRMLADWSDTPEGADVLGEARDLLGSKVETLVDPHRPEPFATNLDIQLGVFLANEIHRRRLSRRGVVATASLGMSLGEYNHLVDIGAIAFADALRLVAARGRIYDAGPDGMMVSLFPTSRAVVDALVEEARPFGDLAISNENAPSQFVIAGDRGAVQHAAALFAEREYADPVTIEHRIPMHAPRFRPAAEALRPHLEAAPWRGPTRAYWPNVTAAPVERATPAEIVSLLTEHVHRPVLWRQSIEAVLERHPGAIFVEVGARRVLCNLLGRKWVRNPRFAAAEDDLDRVVEAVSVEAAE
ncbi:MAG: ACP S-malonyltransferase [Pseudomonadota bacterium]